LTLSGGPVILVAEKEAIMQRNGTSPGAAGAGREEENGFRLALPMTVLGNDPFGRPFAEETILGYMSHAGASFDLKTPVVRGSRLDLSISLPPRLAADAELKLFIRGRVVFLERVREDSPLRKISIKLESKYAIGSDARNASYETTDGNVPESTNSRARRDS